MKYIFHLILALLNTLYHIIRYVLRFIFTFQYKWGEYISSYYFWSENTKHLNHKIDPKLCYNKTKRLENENFLESFFRWINFDYE